MKHIKKTRVYIDGASRGNPGHGACAAVLLDETGRIVREEGCYLGKCTNNFAEYNALRLALREAGTLAAQELDIFSDSELLVKQFNGEYRIKDATLSALMREIKKLSAHFKNVTLTHIPREKNAHADKLANKILDAALTGQETGDSFPKPAAKKIYQPKLF